MIRIGSRAGADATWLMSWLRQHRGAVVAILLAGLVWIGAFLWGLDRELGPSARWGQELEAYERLDATNPPPERAVLFIGSSSIRLWRSLRRDFPRYRVFRRALNGARLTDTWRLVDELVAPYDPEMVIVYGGDNDLADGLRPAEVLREYGRLIDRIREQVPGARVGILSIKPSPSRWHLIHRIRETNRRLREWCEQREWLDFIDVHSGMLHEQGSPRPAQFEADGLHPSPRGYSVWADRIRPFLPRTAHRSNAVGFPGRPSASFSPPAVEMARDQPGRASTADDVVDAGR